MTRTSALVSTDGTSSFTYEILENSYPYLPDSKFKNNSVQGNTSILSPVLVARARKSPPPSCQDMAQGSTSRPGRS